MTLGLGLISCTAGGRLVIINLQRTPKDRHANLLIHGRTDEVMQQVGVPPCVG